VQKHVLDTKGLGLARVLMDGIGLRWPNSTPIVGTRDPFPGHGRHHRTAGVFRAGQDSVVLVPYMRTSGYVMCWRPVQAPSLASNTWIPPSWPSTMYSSAAVSGSVAATIWSPRGSMCRGRAGTLRTNWSVRDRCST
jgi:hypothetical protein